MIGDLNKSQDVVKLATASLVKCHRQAVAAVGDGQLGPGTLVDGRYPHQDVSATGSCLGQLLCCILCDFLSAFKSFHLFVSIIFFNVFYQNTFYS